MSTQHQIDRIGRATRTPPLPTRITARWAARCTKCHGTVRPGQSVFWTRGRGVHHSDPRECDQASRACQP